MQEYAENVKEYVGIWRNTWKKWRNMLKKWRYVENFRPLPLYIGSGSWNNLGLFSFLKFIQPVGEAPSEASFEVWLF